LATLFIDLLQKNFGLSASDTGILGKTMRQLKRSERRYYFKQLKPREKHFKRFLHTTYASLDPSERRLWLDAVVQSMLDRGGEPDIADTLAMGVIGRLPAYNTMKERAEKEGIKLKALVNYGGISTVIMLVGAVTALLLYLFAR